MNARHLVVALACLTVAATADAQWAVTVKPTMDPLPAGFCAAVHLTVTDPVLKDIPRNPQGHRVTMADFDMSVTSPNGAAVGLQIDASHWNACSCQGASAGTVATVTATYPAQGLPAAARVPGVAIQQTATFTVAPPKGPLNPVGCQAAGTSIASGTPPPSGGSTPATPPAGGGSIAPTPSGGGSTPAGAAPAPVPITPVGGNPTAKTPGAVVWTNPAWMKAVQTGQGQVELSWAAVPGISDYHLMGVPQVGGYIAKGVTSLAVPAQSGCNCTWSVGSVYTPAQTSTSSYTKATLQLVHMTNPSSFTAVETTPDQVKLSWQAVPGVAYYGLFGPGVASGGEQVMAGTTTFTATSVPAGKQQWSVGSYYMPGQLNLGLGTFPTATATVTVPPPAPVIAGTYLVTMTALRAYQASMDDVLSRDGIGDEVYAAAYVRRYDRKTGTIVDFTNLQSAAYGDVNKFGTQRIQAGTRSGTGGIQDGDPIPSGSFVVSRTTPAQTITFPLKLWEGTLTDDVDALIITPSIWEQDGGTPLYDAWVQQQAALNISLFATPSVQTQITSKGFGTLVSGAQGIGGGGWLGSQIKGAADMALMHFGLPLATILSTSNDRPIGMLANGVDEAMLPNRAIVLTREIIEAALAQPALGPIPSPVQGSPAAMARIPVMAAKPGIIMLQFEDHGMPGMFIFSERPAIYQMFVQVERVP